MNREVKPKKRPISAAPRSAYLQPLPTLIPTPIDESKVVIRKADPIKNSTINGSLRFWMEENNPKPKSRPITGVTRRASKESIPSKPPNLMNKGPSNSISHYQRPNSFLSKVGPQTTTLGDLTYFESKVEESKSSLRIKESSLSSDIDHFREFTTIDMNKSLKTQIHKMRPQTSKLPPRVKSAALPQKHSAPRPFTAANTVSVLKGPLLANKASFKLGYDDLEVKEDLDENEEIYDKIQELTNKQMRPKSSFKYLRPISGKSSAPESFFTNFSKHTAFNEIDLPYEDLFDRNERTLAATFAKFGNLSYLSPLQRIGAYMQYSAKLKMEHLLEIINLQKTKFEIPIQLSIIDDLNPFQRRTKTGITTTFKAEDLKRVPVSLSVYPEYFDDEDEEGDNSAQLAKEYFIRMLVGMGGNYDPQLIGNNNFIYIDPRTWPPSIAKTIETSIARYNRYLYSSDLILPEEIPKFKKSWMTNSINLISEDLLDDEELVRSNFQEVFEDYKIAMKKAMLNYILRSPIERKRLHIELLPRPFENDGQRISREGGFSCELYPQWHAHVQESTEFVRERLLLVSPLHSALLDWFQDFSHFVLVETESIKHIGFLGYSLSIDAFFKLQGMYKTKCTSLLKNIWLRGCMCLVRKGKLLRKIGSAKGRWTFNGYKSSGYNLNRKEMNTRASYLASEIQDDPEALYSTLVQEQVEIDEKFDFYEGIRLKDLFSIDYQLPEEKSLRHEILSSVSTLMSLQLRSIIEASLVSFLECFLNYPTMSSLFGNEIFTLSTLEPLHNEIERERLSGFFASSILAPYIGPFPLIMTFPRLLSYEGQVSPFLRLEVKIEDQEIVFGNDEKNVSNEFERFLWSIVSSFADFYHPRNGDIFEKEEAPPKSVFENRRAAVSSVSHNFNLMSESESVYLRFAPAIEMRQKEESNKTKPLLTEDANLKTNRPCYLKSPNYTEPRFGKLITEAVNHVISNYSECTHVLDIFELFKPFIDGSLEEEIEIFLRKKPLNPLDVENYIGVIEKFEELLFSYPNIIYLGLFDVSLEGIKSQIYEVLMGNKEKILLDYEESLVEAVKALNEKYTSVVTYLRKSIKDSSQVEAMEKFKYSLSNEKILIKHKSIDLFRSLIFLEKLNHIPSETTLFIFRDLHNWPENLEKEIDLAEDKHLVEKGKLEEALKHKKAEFILTVQVSFKRIEEIKEFTEYSKYKSYLSIIQEVESTVQSLEDDRTNVLEQEQRLFGFVGSYESLDELANSLKPYSMLWAAIADYCESKAEVMKSPPCKLIPVSISKKISDVSKVVEAVETKFPASSVTTRIVNEFRDDIKGLKSNFNMLSLLSTEGLTDRHWQIITGLMSIEYDFRADTVRELLFKGIESLTPEISGISETASREFALEKSLSKMTNEWSKLRLEVSNHKTMEFRVLSSIQIEELSLTLDDHLSKTQSLLSSPSIDFLLGEAKSWETTLLFLQEAFDLLISTQTSFLYLAPLFTFEETSGHLRAENEKFVHIISVWTGVVEGVEKAPGVLELQRRPLLLKSLKECLVFLDQIHKSLESHLELKRLTFPKFFFISNEELLAMVATSRDLDSISEHLVKIFPTISTLIISTHGEILGISSKGGEEFVFEEKIIPREFGGGAIEAWLNSLDEQIRFSLSKSIENSLLDINSSGILRREWLRKWPSQVIYCVEKLRWSLSVEETYSAKGLPGLRKYLSTYLDQLEESLTLMKGNLASTERSSISALIIQEVCNRDILVELIDRELNDLQEYEWQSQLRYSWNITTSQLAIKMFVCSLSYGYEYFPSSERIVITPLTQKAFRTMISSVNVNFGCALEGPAGSGKTETIKELSRVIGVNFVPFNCSEEVQLVGVIRFFKGIVTTGSWAIMDQFARLTYEILAVVSEYVMKLQAACVSGRGEIYIGGVQLALKPMANVFLTLNPGYIGRNEIPESLKSYFRTICLITPDIAIISEIILFSAGFQEASTLAKKLHSFYEVCAKTFSRQYDFSLRNIKLLLRMAERLFLAKKSNESHIIRRCIESTLLPSISASDERLFIEILSTYFLPSPPLEEYSIFNDVLKKVSRRLKLVCNDSIESRMRELLELVKSRVGVLLLGQVSTGKSTSLKLLYNILQELHKMGDPDILLPQKFLINPKAQSIERLYGYFEVRSGDWVEGLIGDILKRMAASSSKRNMLIIDGPLSVDWAENLNSLLDDNAKISLSSGETISISANNSFIFESDSLDQVSPATISRLGIINFDKNKPVWPLMMAELENEAVSDLFEGIVFKCIEQLEIQGIAFVPASLVFSFRAMFVSLTSQGFKEYSIKDEDGIQISFTFSLVWALGNVLESEQRSRFSVFLNKLLREPVKCSSKKEKLVKIENWNLPQDFKDVTIFDYFLEDFRWKLYSERLERSLKTLPSPPPKDSKELDSKFVSECLFIPTLKSVRCHFFMSFCSKQGLSFILHGGRECGKSHLIREFTKDIGSNDILLSHKLTSFTSSQHLQESLEERLERRRKGVFGPLIGSKVLIWIDDLSYNSQESVTEFLRHLLENGQWYSKERKQNEIVDWSLALSCNSSSLPSARLVSKLISFGVEEIGVSEHKSIFTRLTENFLNKFQVSSYSDIGLRMHSLAETAIDIHYSFAKTYPISLSRLANGVGLSSSLSLLTATHSFGQPLLIYKGKQLRVLVHEAMRVYGDRLEESQAMEFLGIICNSIKTRYKINDEVLLTELGIPSLSDSKRNLNFSDFKFAESKENGYDEISNWNDYSNAVIDWLSHGRATPIFESTIFAFSRINRILSFFNSHAILFSSNHFESLSILESIGREKKIGKSIDPLKEDFEELLISLILKPIQHILILSQDYLTHPFNSHFISLLLERGFGVEFFNEGRGRDVMEKVEEQLIRLNEVTPKRSQIIEYCVSSVRSNLHIFVLVNQVEIEILALHQSIPQLFKFCVPIWISDWKEDSYRSLASEILGGSKIGDEADFNLLSFILGIHEGELKRGGREANPTLFTKFLDTIANLYNVKSTEITSLINKYEIGLQKLETSFTSLALLEEELKAKQPKLQLLKNEAEVEAREIEAKAKELEPKKDKAAEFNEIVKTKAEAAQISKEECERELARVKPKLALAEESIMGLEPKHIESLRSMQRPPDPVKLVMEAFCILVQIPPLPTKELKEPKDPKNPKETVKSYWEAAKKMLGEKDSLKSLLSFDKDNIPPTIAAIIRNQYISRTADFNPKRIEKASSAAKGICQWVLAISEYDKILQNAKPTFEKYAKAESDLIFIREELLMAESELRTLEGELNQLKDDYDDRMKNISEFRNEIEISNIKVGRAQSLLKEFKSENERWGSELEKLKFFRNVLLSSSILTSAGLLYLGGKEGKERGEAVKSWISLASAFGVLVDEGWQLDSLIGDSLSYQKWFMNGLALDSFSKENGILIFHCPTWPLIIDPSSLCSKFLRSLESENKVISTTERDSSFAISVEKALEFGYPLIIENIGNSISIIVRGLLGIPKARSKLRVNITGKEVDVSPYFKLYLLTKERQISFEDHLTNTFTIVNFSLTKSALIEQLLDVAITKEKPDLDEARNKLSLSYYLNKKTLREYDEKILNVLNSVEDFIADDSALEILVKSKEIGLEISKKESESRATESKIQEMRDNYQPLAELAASLYLVVDSLEHLNGLYKFSTSAFLKQFGFAFDKATRSSFMAQRLSAVQEVFVSNLFNGISKSLFCRNKGILSLLFMLCLKGNRFNIEDIRGFVSGVDNLTLDCSNQAVEEKLRVLEMEVNWTSRLREAFAENPEILREFLSSDTPLLASLPDFFSTLNSLQKLILVKSLRPDKIMNSVQSAVRMEIGKTFVDNLQMTMASVFEESNCQTPILFLLEDSDPSAQVLNYANSKGRKIKILGLHSAHYELINTEISDSSKNGNWVYLQNCHLSPESYPFLEGLVERVAKEDTSHPSFRLVLSVTSQAWVPPTILQSSFIVAHENENGFNSTFVSILSNEILAEKSFFKRFPKIEVLGLIFLHYCVIGRKKWGELGWIDDYKFSTNDFYFGLSQLMEMRNKSPDSLVANISKFARECVYGAKVTGESDLEVLRIFCEEVYNERMGDRLLNYGFNENMDYDRMLMVSKGLPFELEGKELGFSDSMVIYKKVEEFKTLVGFLGKLYFPTSLTSMKKISNLNLSEIQKRLKFIESNFSRNFDLTVLIIQFPISIHLNGFLISELITCNEIIGHLMSFKKEVELMICGQGQLTLEMYQNCLDFSKDTIPEKLRNALNTKDKSLSDFFKILKVRIEFYRNWCNKGRVNVFKLNFFFNPHAFIPALKSFFFKAGGTGKAGIEDISLEFDYADDDEKNKIYLEELRIKGAKFDVGKKRLVDCDPDNIFNTLPRMVILVKSNSTKKNKFDCPAFIDSEMKEFLCNISLEIKESPDFWIKRGISIFSGNIK